MKQFARAVAMLAFVLAAIVLAPAASAKSASLKVMSNTTLTEDFHGNVVIAKNGVTLDCNGHEIVGNGNGRGVLVDKRSGVTVKNCDVHDFSTGFFVASTTSSTFEGNSSHDNQLGNSDPGWIAGAGFWMQHSSGNTLGGNQIYGNPSDGLDMLDSANNVVVGNVVDSNGAGLFLFGTKSQGNLLQGNSAALNEYAGFTVAEGASHNTLTSNDGSGNPNAGFIIDGATENSIALNNANNNGQYGIALTNHADSNSLTANVANGNGAYGIVVWDSSNNAISANTALLNVEFDAVQDGVVSENVWADNTFGTTFGI